MDVREIDTPEQGIIRLSISADEWGDAALNRVGTLYHSWGWGELRRAEGWISWRVLIERSQGVG